MNNNQYNILPLSTPKTLGEIFLDLLEKNSNDQMRQTIQKTRIIIKSPDCAELFNVILVNTLGCFTQISEEKVDNAIAVIIEKNELAIDNDFNISNEEKETQKIAMRTFMYFSKDILKNVLQQNNILIS